MRYFFLAFSCFLIILGCSNKKKLPAGIFPRDEMEDVIWDMMRTGQFLNNFVLYKDTSINVPQETKKWYDKVYQLHGITKAQFDKSYTYYRQHSELMKEVLDSISRRTNNVPPGQEKATPPDTIPKRPDSIPVRPRPLRAIDSIKIPKIFKRR
jgi:Domain of unknown function (DUF4296)